MAIDINFRVLDELERRYDGPIPAGALEYAMGRHPLAGALSKAKGNRRMFGRLMREQAAEVRRARAAGNDNRVIQTLRDWDFYRLNRRGWHRHVLWTLGQMEDALALLAAE